MSETLTLRQLTEVLGDLPAVESDPELELVELQAGQVLFEQGDSGDSVYVLVAGALGVRVGHEDGSETVVDKLAPGSLVGEMALLSGRPRSATVYALVDAGLFRLTKSAFDQIVERDQAAEETLGATVTPRWQRIQLARALKELFGELDATALHLLQKQTEWLRFSNGDVVFRQGDPADGLNVVVNGRLRITATTAAGDERYIGEVEPGQTVGEFALLTDEARAATVHAVRESNVARIGPDLFHELIRRYPEMLSQITRFIVERRQRALQWKPTAHTTLTLAILPANPGVDAWRFAQELAMAFAEHGTALALDSEAVDARAGRHGFSQTPEEGASAQAVDAWLDDLEGEQDYLLFAADPGPTAWTQRCIGHADRVLIVADPEGDPAPGVVERSLAQMDVPIRSELVMWHRPETVQPRGTLAWLKPRTVRAHHHIRQGERAHMERLARRLTGKAIALVFGGGGARGFAHMGVHRALEELGIPVDYVGGTSMGAMMGAAVVYIGSNARVMELSQQFANPRVLFDRTLPLTAMMASKKVTRLTQTLFGDARIEDQWIPFFCVATNLTTAERVVLQQGPIWRAVRASLAIPGIFTPVIEDGETLVDGGVMDNFPTRLMSRLCESRRIVGVNVAPLKEEKRYYDFETDISGWRVLLSRLNPFSKPLRTPSLVGTIMRTLEINSLRRSREDAATVELMIYPPVKEIGFQDYDRYEEVTEIGYGAALELLRAWRESALTPAQGGSA